MSSELLIEVAGRGAVFALAIGIAVGAKALASVLRTWIEQASRTHRLIKAIEDSTPNQRPQIITACGQLEGRSDGKPRSDTAGRMPHDRSYHRPPPPIPPIGRHNYGGGS
jgi:hypothetical protein